MGRTGRICSVVMIGIVGVLLMSCGGATVRESESMVPSHRDPGVIALVPFSASRPDTSGGRLVRFPERGGYITGGEIVPESPQIITGLFRRRLVGKGYNLVSQEMVARELPALRRQEERPGVLAQKLAFQLKVDSVLMGWIFRYRERIGNAWGVEQPASVAFMALLFDGGDGKLLWRGKFDETQKPLSENVLLFFSFVRRGGRWLTAKQLASDGISRILLTFPGEEKVGVNR